MTMAEDPQQSNGDTPTPEESHSLLKAPRAILEAKARGDCADGLVLQLVNDITACETASGQRKNARRKGLEKLNDCSTDAIILNQMVGCTAPCPMGASRAKRFHLGCSEASWTPGCGRDC